VANLSWIDYLLILTGVVAAAAAGVPFPLMGIIFGQLVNDMNDAIQLQLAHRRTSREWGRYDGTYRW